MIVSILDLAAAFAADGFYVARNLIVRNRFLRIDFPIGYCDRFSS
ncbi:hypothetical protein [Allorhizobium undicola]|nr:hypothetical protein [Allorhizobium undicola]